MESGKSAVQNYQAAVSEKRAESNAANTKAAQDFINYIDKGYESDSVADNLRSLALDILLPTGIVRTKLEQKAGTFDKTDPARAVETVADVVSLIPVAGGLLGGAAKVATKATTTLTKAAGAVSTASAVKKLATSGTGTAATKAITQEADMAKLSGITKLIKKVVPSTSKTTTKTTVKTTPTKTTTKTSTTKKTTPQTSAVKTTSKAATAKTSTAAITVKKAPATTSTAKTSAAATKSTTTGSKALNALKAAGAVGSTGLTALWGYTMVDELLNPTETPTLTIDDTTTPEDENPFITEDPGLYDDTGLYDGTGSPGVFDTGLGGAYSSAEQAAEEILEPLSEVPIVGDVVTGAAENGLSLPLIAGVILAVGAVAYFAYKKTAKNNGKRKTSAKKTPKRKAKGAAA